MKPPEDVAPSDLYQKLQEAPAPSEVIDFPRKDKDGNPVFQVRIFVLQMTDHNWARLEARKWVRKKLEAEGSIGKLDDDLLREVYGDATARFLLQRAIRRRDPIPGVKEKIESGQIVGPLKLDHYPVVFFKPEDIDALLRAPELETLFRAYELIQHKYGPLAETVSDEDATAWIKALVEGAEANPLMRCDWLHLADLTLSLAQRAYTLCVALESQYSSLPPTLASSLAQWGIGTGLSGWRRASSLMPSLGLEVEEEESLDPLDEPQPMLLQRPWDREHPEEVTLERAARLARDMSERDDVPEV